MDYDDRPLDGPWSKRPDSPPDLPKSKKPSESKRPKEKKPNCQTKPKKSDERPRKKEAKENPEQTPKPPEDCLPASVSPKKDPKAGQLQELLQPRNIQAVVMAAEILNQRGGKARKYLKL